MGWPKGIGPGAAIPLYLGSRISAAFLWRNLHCAFLSPSRSAAVQYRLKRREPQPNPNRSQRSRQIAVSFRSEKTLRIHWQFVSSKGVKTRTFRPHSQTRRLAFTSLRRSSQFWRVAGMIRDGFKPMIKPFDRAVLRATQDRGLDP